MRLFYHIYIKVNGCIYSRFLFSSKGGFVLKLSETENDSGKQDITNAFLGEGLPGPAQEQAALKTEKAAVLACLSEPSETKMETLCHRLEEVPLSFYFVRLNERFRSLFSEGIFDRDCFHSFAEKLVSGKYGKEAVKLGILILANYEDAKTRSALQKFGTDGNYTLYVVEASKTFSRRESFLFELAKRLDGYAKMAVTSAMRPLTDEMKQWMFLEGSKNSVLPEMAAIICLENADMVSYMKSLPISAEVFGTFSRLFSNAFRNSKIIDFTASMPLVTAYAEAAPEMAQTFLDYSALQTISASLTLSLRNGLKSGSGKNGWAPSSVQSVLAKCQRAMNRETWHGIILSEMRNPSFSSRKILDAARADGLKPDFTDFLPMLWHSPCDFSVINYLVGENYRTYTQDTLCYMKANLPEKVFSGALNPAENEISQDYEPDLALCLLLKEMNLEVITDLPFFLRCLDCRLPDCRKEAVRGLRQSRTLWGAEVIPALEKALGYEPAKQVKKCILRLLGRKDEKSAKEQRYVELPTSPVEPDAEDVFLLKTHIAGAYYRDLMAVDGVLEEGDMLYLVREPENAYDSNAILIATDDGYVLGYLPRAENRFPAALMDSGRALYAFLTDIDLAKSQLFVEIYLSQKTNLDTSGRPILRLLQDKPQKP